MASYSEARVAALSDELLPLAASGRSGPREGLLWLLVFLPGSLGAGFARLLPRALPAVLQGLADDVEAVRDGGEGGDVGLADDRRR